MVYRTHKSIPIRVSLGDPIRGAGESYAVRGRVEPSPAVVFAYMHMYIHLFNI